MRKVLLSAVALTGLAVTASMAGCAPAVAEPYAEAYGYGYQPGGIVEPVQYDWRWRERERRHEEWVREHRREEWRHRHGEFEHRGW